jgi:hypothetical protein
VPATQAPFSLQVSGVRLPGPEQRFVPGLQSPVQAPCPVQTFGQGIGSATHAPAALQVSGVWLAPQCFSVGRHMPEHAPALQVDGQVSLATHSPSTVHTSTAAPEGAQRVAPAVHAEAEDSDGASRTGDPPLPEVPPVVLPASAPPSAPDEPPAGPSDCERASVRAGSVFGSYLFGSAQPAANPASTRILTNEQRASSLKALSSKSRFRRSRAGVASRGTLSKARHWLPESFDAIRLSGLLRGPRPVA